MTARQRPGPWVTVATVPYAGAVGARRENPAAHGGVTLRQTRAAAGGGVEAREVNQNGRHVEVGPVYPAQSFRWGRS